MFERKVRELQDFLRRKAAEEKTLSEAALSMDEKLIHDCYARSFKLSAKWLLEAIEEG